MGVSGVQRQLSSKKVMKYKSYCGIRFVATNAHIKLEKKVSNQEPKLLRKQKKSKVESVQAGRK